MAALAESQAPGPTVFELPFNVAPQWKPMDEDVEHHNCQQIESDYFTATANGWSDCAPTDTCLSSATDNEEMCQVDFQGNPDLELDHDGFELFFCSNENFGPHGDCKKITKDLTKLMAKVSTCKLKDDLMQPRFQKFQIDFNGKSTARVIPQLWYTDYAAFSPQNKPNCSPDVCRDNFMPCTEVFEQSIRDMAKQSSPYAERKGLYKMKSISGSWIKRYVVENSLTSDTSFAGFGVTLSLDEPF
eukprot:Clim_evm35s247 gene=Clim_evmTU35s247